MNDEGCYPKGGMKMAKAKYILFDMPEDLKIRTYEAVEMAKSSGKIKKGTNEVTKIIERAQAKFVVMAEDVTPQEIMMHIPYLCKEKQIPFAYVPRRKELGSAAGMNVSTAAVAIVNPGKARVLLEELTNNVKQLMK